MGPLMNPTPFPGLRSPKEAPCQLSKVKKPQSKREEKQVSIMYNLCVQPVVWNRGGKEISPATKKSKDQTNLVVK